MGFLLQWSLDITKGQGTGERFVRYNDILFSVYITIAAGVKKTVHYTEDFVI